MDISPSVTTPDSYVDTFCNRVRLFEGWVWACNSADLLIKITNWYIFTYWLDGFKPHHSSIDSDDYQSLYLFKSWVVVFLNISKGRRQNKRAVTITDTSIFHSIRGDDKLIRIVMAEPSRPNWTAWSQSWYCCKLGWSARPSPCNSSSFLQGNLRLNISTYSIYKSPRKHPKR